VAEPGSAAPDNRELILEVVSAFNALDVERLVASCDPEIELVAERSAFEGVYRGHDGVRRWESDLHDVAPDYALTVTELRELSGGRVLVLGRQGGHSSEAAPPIDAPLAAIFTCREGKLIRGQAFATEADAVASADSA
jgi:ketosteroid isomerase-like protein